MKIVKNHNSTKEATKAELEERLPALLQRYGEIVSNTEYAWQKDMLSFHFQVKGFDIKGKVLVTDKGVTMEVAVPLLLHLLEGMMHTKLDQALIDDFPMWSD